MDRNLKKSCKSVHWNSSGSEHDSGTLVT